MMTLREIVSAVSAPSTYGHGLGLGLKSLTSVHPGGAGLNKAVFQCRMQKEDHDFVPLCAS